MTLPEPTRQKASSQDRPAAAPGANGESRVISIDRYPEAALECATQEELDYFWGKLSAIREAEQCGWLKDQYSLSWQIVPAALRELMSGADPDKSNRIMRAVLQMKKIDIGVLKRAYEGG